MKKGIHCSIVMVALLIGSSAWASTFPTPYNVRIRNQTSGLWSNHPPTYSYGGTYYEVWDVSIEQGTANSGDRFQLWYYDEGTDYEYAYMYENSSYDEVFDVHYGAPTYDYIMSEANLDIDWVDNQVIAYLVHDDNGTNRAIYLRVQLYTIGK